MGPVSAASFLPALIILVIGTVPRIAGRYGKKTSLMIGGSIEAAGFLIVSIFPGSLPATIAGMVLKSIGMGFVNALLFATVSDIAVYTEVTQKGNYSGITNSITSFGQKIGIDLGAAVGWLLVWGQYDGTLTVQSAQAQLAEQMGFGVVPFICTVIVILLMAFVDVDKKLIEIK